MKVKQRINRSAWWYAVVILVCCISGCAALPEKTVQSSPKEPDTLEVSHSLAATVVGPWPEWMWWKTLGDRQLDQLMDEALSASPTLRLAETRIRRASALAGLADSVRHPQLGAGASSIYQRFTENGAVPPPLAGETRSVSLLALEFNYDLDLWGKNKAAYEAALGSVRVAEIEAQMAKLALASSIATSYIRLDLEHARLNVQRELLRQREELTRLTAKRVSAGLDSSLELEHSQGLTASARAEIRATEERMALIGNQLAALAGAGPDRRLSIKPPVLLAQIELTLPARLPSELIGRRPDVVAQLWRIESMTKGIKAARSAFYPNVNLTAFAGFDSIGIENALRGGSGVFGVGPALTLPIFDGGRLRSNLALRSAEYDESVERYNILIVEAMREVADQVVSWRGIEAQRAEEREAETKLEEANRLALLRYRQGLTNYLTVLATEGELLREKLRSVELKARHFEVAANLSTALGGGFQPEPPGAFSSRQEQKRSSK